MDLRPIELADVELVAAWMSAKENYQWLDFGNGQKPVTAISIRVMCQRNVHLMRLIVPAATPVGIACLSNIESRAGTATLWYVLGDKRQAGKGITTEAVSRMLAIGFHELGLGAIHAWAVATNQRSIRVLERNGFRLIGRQRRCHRIDDQVHDRLLFDLLAEEYARH